MNLLEKLEKEMPELKGPLLVGLSGGPDSVALLLLLLKRRDEGKLDFICVHVNHGLRGRESDGDEAFVREICGRKGVPLSVFRLNPPPHPGEGWAREERYRCFEKVYREESCQAVALAHHMQDQAETVLLHLLRGSGVQGLGGMESVSCYHGMTVVRPLLEFTRDDLIGMLIEQCQMWREDSTNLEDGYLRNRVRHTLLPRMEEMAPGCTKRLSGLAVSARREHRALEEMARNFPGMDLSLPCLPVKALRSMPDGLRDVALRLWWERLGPDRKEQHLGRELTLRLSALADGKNGDTVQLPGGMEAVRGWTHLHLTGTGTLPVPRLHMEPEKGGTGDGKRTQAFPDGFLEGTEVRFRKTGDWIRPFGSGHRQKLQDYLVNRHVDAPFRDRIPLLCRGQEVLWVCGIGCGDVPRREDYGHAVMASWQGEILWM